MQTGYYYDKALGYAQIAAGGLDAAVFVQSAFAGGVVPAGTVMLIIQPETHAIRMRDDGTNPTAAVGYPLAAGAEFRYTGQVSLLKAISQVAGAALNVWAFG